MTKTEVSSARRRAAALSWFAVAVMALVCLAVVDPVAAAGKRVAAVQSTLYFGLATPKGTGVSEQQWAAFLAEVVTPRFPDGLTVFTAYGQGGPKPGVVTAETTKVLLIVHPETAAAAARIDKIAAEFRRRFGQAPFRTEQPVTIVE